MNRFQQYLNVPLNMERLRDAKRLKQFGVSIRYLPESFDFLDEAEFLLPYTPERNLVVTVAAEQGIIKRILFGWAPVEDTEEALFPFSQEELNRMLAEKGDVLHGFLSEITSP